MNLLRGKSMFKRILSGLLAAFIASAAFAVDVKISAEPAMSALAGTEIFLGNQSGVTKTATAAQFGTYVLTVANTVFSFNAGTSFSGASWSTTSPVFNGAAMTLNDTTASGTVTNETGYSLQAVNFTSTGGASTTITNASTLWVNAPTCSGGLVCTSLYAASIAGNLKVVGVGSGNVINGPTVINGSVNNATSLNTGSSNAAVHIADGSGNNAIGIGNGTSVVTATGAFSFNTNANNAFNIGTGTSTGTITFGQNSATPGSVVLNGPVTFNAGTAFSAANWGLTSPVWNAAALTLNDTAASGTVTNDYAYTVQAANFTSTGGASTTITNAGTLYIAAPTCTTVVCTNLFALNTPGKIAAGAGASISGGSILINNSSNNNTTLNGGTSTGTVTLGGTTAGNIVNVATVSWKVGAVLYGSVTAPTISSHFNSSGDSIVAASTAAFQITVGSGAGTTTGAVTMPAATTGWSCEATDVTTPASHAIQQTGSSTTLVTVTDYIRTTGIAQNFANGDKINFICGAF